ncbi:von Hippel-Lindau disease tumor suppressor-like isoform X3 [Mytilus californianus]|uniref:von Hippel-Lindau disease tumor suppressor-like isoform X1 n=1 Tax=Mytilus californianus TaxID=6549 RepID=UPI0022474FB8|nr:von Hippel-Lindau disease tumor suppressor-like isoform X1 [Mytilus californianus]XP_052065285.1 von Hippel-Lindau disease tumor suppressor-like isoform X2 [Mytilus californianus]XP_052065286.1 von Hippel-Lindau disease tumor suppressor-like isoform X3 [Mytilus californianus]
MEKINAEPIVRSLQGGKISYTLFENRSSCVASMYWHNFEGQKIKYADVKPKETYSMKTYEEHPWSAQDPATGNILLIDNNSVFYPRHSPTTHERVFIDNPTDKEKDTDLEDNNKGIESFGEAKGCPAWVRRKLTN